MAGLADSPLEGWADCDSVTEHADSISAAVSSGASRLQAALACLVMPATPAAEEEPAHARTSPYSEAGVGVAGCGGVGMKYKLLSVPIDWFLGRVR